MIEKIIYVLMPIAAVALLVQITRITELLSKINKEEPNKVTTRDNDFQGKLYFIVLMAFIIFVIWQMIVWGPLLLPAASSVHGEIIDGLMNLTMNLILVVFFVLTPLLGYFLYRYRAKERKFAYFYSHNNKLEIVWTIIPAIVLTGVIVYGLRVWDQAMNPDLTNASVVEVYSKQFGWTARYSGGDNTLGSANYRLIQGPNQLGIDLSDSTSHDDIIAREVHLVKDKPVLLKFRSQDVIHSAFIPHFRVQMNCVPGITTQFGFTPTKTTSEMKAQEGEDFEYMLVCNKICGGAHYNMGMKFIVETQQEYDMWLSQQNNIKNTLLTL